MLTSKQVKEIREHLERAGSPIFFFDNDVDGLCSFLLLQRYVDKGKGVPIKSFPKMNITYFRKVEELNADYIFILDKPLVSKEFFDEAEKRNIPVVWIDHHDVQDEHDEMPEFVNYYNVAFNKDKSNEPVTYLCYQIINDARKKEDLWFGVVGCISDKFVPDFYEQFKKEYPDLSIEGEDAFDILYSSRIGKIVEILSFALKDRTTNVVNMMKFLMQVKSPYEVLEDSSKNHTMHYRFKQIDEKYQHLLKKAEELEKTSGKLLFFQYGGEMSMSSDLANELSYKFKDKIIVVVYIKGSKANISGRGKNVKEFILKAISGLEDSRGGGHEDAVGAQVRVEDIENLRGNLLKLVG